MKQKAIAACVTVTLALAVWCLPSCESEEEDRSPRRVSAGTGGSGMDAGAGDATAGDGGASEGGAEDAGEDASGCALAEAADLQDDYLFALSVLTAPTKPIVGMATFTITGAASATLEIRPLKYDDYGSQAGEALVAGPFPIEADGSFVADFGEVSIQGSANPISGSVLTLTLSLHAAAGSLCKPADFACGAMQGVMSSPITGLDLSGSTFALVRVQDPSNLPTPVLKCEGDQGPTNP